MKPAQTARRRATAAIGDLLGNEDVELVTVACDDCGKPTEAGWAAQEYARRFGGKPPARCPGCYEERHCRERALSVATSHVDAKVWKAFREDWLKTTDADTHERLAARLMAQVDQKELYAPLLAAWRTTRRGRGGGKRGDGDAGF